MIARAGSWILALLAVALGCASLTDAYLNGYLTLGDFRPVAAAAAFGTAFLVFAFFAMRRRAQEARNRAQSLETSLATLKAANERLAAGEARYKGLVDAQGDAILRRAPDGRITYANEGFFKLFGVRPEDTIGEPFRPEPHPDSLQPIFGRLAGRELGRERVTYDHHVKTVAGFRWIAWEDYPIRDSDGHLIEIQSVGRDITERKILEAALTEARDKAQEASGAKSRFLATMSHEIRTPMNGVLGMARLLLETPLAPDQKTYAEAIRQSGLSLLALIEDVLDFSKIESGALVIERGEVAVRPLIEGIAELLSTRAHAKEIEIATAIAPEVPLLLRADGIRLRQVLTNLVGNAVKFTEEGGVLITAAVEVPPGAQAGAGAGLLVRVRDTGIGVPPEKRDEIFEDFVQADSSHGRRFEGTGLGLAISKRLVAAMGGRIGVLPGETKGSIFWISLPLEDCEKRPAPYPLKGRRVALVCASPVLRNGLKLQLEAAGADYVQARDLGAAFGMRPLCDLVLLDAAKDEAEPFPDITGIETPVVALLPPSRRAQLTALSQKGIRGYLMKPVRQDSLEKRLAAVLAGETELIAPPPAAAPAVRRTGTGLSILLAEDNPVNALLARELLRRRGHTVEEVTTGEAAVLACAAKRFDLVIMDLHMPGLDGIEATLRIRGVESAEGLKPVPIFALTADALETGRKACLDAGMDGFFTKPVDPAELDAVLATITPSAVLAAE
jgi:PAS domain S-box-containing protein